MSLHRLLTLLALAALALPATAVAGPRAVPPGNSGANQYTETLPGPGGNQPTGDLGDRDASPAKELGQRNAAQLEQLGADGRAAAELAAKTSAGPSAGQGAEKATSHEAAEPSGSSGLSQVLGEVSGSSDSGGMGFVLPLLILLGLLGAVAFALGRRRAQG